MKIIKKENYILFVIALCLSTLAVDGREMEVFPAEIIFDYDQNSYLDDALSVSDETGTPVTWAEWDSEYGQVSTPAYKRSQIARSIKVIFGDNYYNGSAHLMVKLTYAPGSSTGIGIPAQSCYKFISEYSLENANEDTVVFELTGALPTTVGKHTFTWKWEIFAIPIDNQEYCASWTTINTTHNFYTLYSDPIAPMQRPWTSVLDKACVWAAGEWSVSNILFLLVDGLYNSGLSYNDVAFHYKIEGNSKVFKLSLLLSEWNEVDCQDCAMLLSVLSSSIGTPLNSTRRLNGPFHTNPIWPIAPMGQRTKSTPRWEFHQIAWYNNKVYDSSLLIDNYPDGSIIPINMDINDPYQILLNADYNGGPWFAYEAFVLGQTDPYFEMSTYIE